jgi:hypothetical protein
MEIAKRREGQTATWIGNFRTFVSVTEAVLFLRVLSLNREYTDLVFVSPFQNVGVFSYHRPERMSMFFLRFSFSGFDKLKNELFLPLSESKSPKDKDTSGSRPPPVHQRYLFKRTKQEAKSSHKAIMSCANTSEQWAK